MFSRVAKVVKEGHLEGFGLRRHATLDCDGLRLWPATACDKNGRMSG